MKNKLQEIAEWLDNIKDGCNQSESEMLQENGEGWLRYLLNVYQVYSDIRKESFDSKKAVKFVEHIENHFKEEHPDWKVKCKICDKTIDEIWEAK